MLSYLVLYSLDPIVSYVPVQNFKLSTISFTLNTTVNAVIDFSLWYIIDAYNNKIMWIALQIQTILVGDSEGQVTVYQLRGMSPGVDKEVNDTINNLFSSTWISNYLDFIKHKVLCWHRWEILGNLMFYL